MRIFSASKCTYPVTRKDGRCTAHESRPRNRVNERNRMRFMREFKEQHVRTPTYNDIRGLDFVNH